MSAVIMGWYTGLQAGTVFTISYPTGGADYPIAIDAGTHAGAYEFAAHVNSAVQAYLPAITVDLTDSGAYRISSSGLNFDLTVDPDDYYDILGFSTVANQSSVTGATDARTYMPGTDVHHEDVGYYLPGRPTVGDTGRVSGATVPAAGYSRMWEFEGLSSAEPVFEESISNDPVVSQGRRVLGMAHAGMPVRIYRDYETDKTAWSTTNADGYTDLVVDNLGGEYRWTNDVMSRYTWGLSGIEVPSGRSGYLTTATYPPPAYNEYYTDHDGSTDYWNDAPAGIPSPSTLPVDIIILAAISGVGAGDELFCLSDGSSSDYLIAVAASGTVQLLGRAGGVNKQVAISTGVVVNDGVPRLYHFHFDTNSDSKIYINGVNRTGTYPIHASWSGPLGLNQASAGAQYDGAVPLLGGIYRAAAHFGTVDKDAVFAAADASWASLNMDHVWYMGDGPSDSNSTIYDLGAVGGWHLGNVGTPTITAGSSGL